MVQLFESQLRALDNMHDGCILCGGVGSGKSITALAYYYMQMGGDRKSVMGGDFKELSDFLPLVIITTARKRDSLEWEAELSRFYMTPETHGIRIDSWNNIEKYKEIDHAFFIFDEQRVVGNGVWVKAFLKIARNNRWILLSATPGDTWSDYIPVFIARGYYRNRTQFIAEHVIYNPHVKFRKIERYIGQGKLLRERRETLVEMDTQRRASSIHKDVLCEYNAVAYKDASRKRWNPYTDEPIRTGSELYSVWRRIVNEDHDRVLELLQLQRRYPRIIIFYNFDYERNILLSQNYGKGVIVAEWSGHKHDEVPTSEKWVYLVQYSAGSEAWNCTETNVIVFYSQTYSYKQLTQAAGRIDRTNTPFDELYYFHLKSRAPIDIAISRALKQKKNFTERKDILC